MEKNMIADNDIIHGRSLKEWKEKYPLLNQMISQKAIFWTNSNFQIFEIAKKNLSLSEKDLISAKERFERFAPYLEKVFPEIKPLNGKISSPLRLIPEMQKSIENIFHKSIPGKLMLKCDNELPIAGSIKARGGIYEVLKIAEDLLKEKMNFKEFSDYSTLTDIQYQKFFENYTLIVGSTGNLGLSIGLMGTKLGFKVNVHMSNDAKAWKKQLLNKKGVHVIEHKGNYTMAVSAAREEALKDPNTLFIDDEKSHDLFLGYSVAALELRDQLKSQNIVADREHPLFVYLPCGVGGAPGGITFGLKMIFGDFVNCYFVEPTTCPSMILGLMTGKHNLFSVEDFGISGKTNADGLAVGRPSEFVGSEIGQLINGIYTIQDSELFTLSAMLYDSEAIKIELSAAAGLIGPMHVSYVREFSKFLENHDINQYMDNAVHVVWATGGIFQPEEIFKQNYVIGKDKNAYSDA